ncbi:GNAT family N-acetyltransferase [Cellulomonas shaoxiangyii]|uniref:GNAT family N-acetyltransferase n=1 Tax=Cellulomonas shaoxiangyii TaxID=2566013 RepID=A0A4P7SKB9_9CELL|nr:GNAT family N-acetyltransferase [Cellulomonas shaoxiangyii]QCB94739.1 GNAT family N-acetyltransferase [Cellulomonas shaoxiangyii]TGY86469.1 GNAT family N-acetyltransferase [Cellulomonas shaoxiangyii]
MTPALALRALTLADEVEALAAHEELAREGFSFLPDGRPDDWTGYLAHLADEHEGVNLPVGRVPATFLVADGGGTIVGRASVRHELNAALARVGGHIGYGVRPAYRRRGFATEILRQSLALARSLGLDRALVTCDDDNVASARTIERCGGVLEDVVLEGASPKRRYWIPTSI